MARQETWEQDEYVPSWPEFFCGMNEELDSLRGRSRDEVDTEYLPRLRRLLEEGADRTVILALNRTSQSALRAAG